MLDVPTYNFLMYLIVPLGEAISGTLFIVFFIMIALDIGGNDHE